MSDTVSLVELKAKGLPRLDWRDVFTFTAKEGGEALSTSDVESLDAYFRQFVPPSDCISCGSKQGGDSFSFAFGLAHFTWGLAHGEGRCSKCGYPARALHYDVGPIKSLNAILQYHPDELEARKEENDAGEP